MDAAILRFLQQNPDIDRAVSRAVELAAFYVANRKFGAILLDLKFQDGKPSAWEATQKEQYRCNSKP